MASFRAVWVDEGNDADFAKLASYDISQAYFAIRDPRVTRPYLRGVRQAGFVAGVYIAPNWYPDMSGSKFAELASAELERVAPATNADFPRVCVDIETHDVAYILAFLKRWRELRPTRTTDWTLEPFQGGLFTPADAIHIAAANVRVIPQLYFGDMAPAAADRVALNLVLASFLPMRLFGFYDAAALPGRWEGYAFTQGRLP